MTMKAPAAMVCGIALCAALRGASAAGMDAGWPTNGGSYANIRHGAVDPITSSNVRRLHPVWSFKLGAFERPESVPIVSGATMYVTTGVGNNVIALDAASGKLKWRYKPLLGAMSPCCGAINRGVAIGDRRVYFATLDAQLIALDSASGKQVWSTRVGDGSKGLSETMAPLFWNGMVFIGSSGSDRGIRGSFSAYRARDGKLLWRWYAVSPGWEGTYVNSVNGYSLHRDIEREKRDAFTYKDAWRHGGGGVWMTPALDTDTGTVYVTTSNPWPVFEGDLRPGDNLYTESIVAIDAHTGKMRWAYQQTPHDVWEYEPASPPILIDAANHVGKRVPAVAEAGKTRWLYVLDRRSGKLIRISSSWSANSDLYKAPAPRAAVHDLLPLRGTIGPVSYDPARALTFIATQDRPVQAQQWRYLALAVDVNTGKIRWKKALGEHPGARGDAILPGTLSEGNLVFVPDPYGALYALDADTGAPRWRYDLGASARVKQHTDTGFWAGVVGWFQGITGTAIPAPAKRSTAPFSVSAPAEIASSPITYEIDGRPYLAITYDVQPPNSDGAAMLTAFSL